MSLMKTLWATRFLATGKPARFVRRYIPPTTPSVTVGDLEFDGMTWTFRYDVEYKHRRMELRPIEGLDDLDRVYCSRMLFPFLAVRIPNIDQDDVKRKLAENHVRNPEPTDLLRIFGRRAISSPAFELLLA
jgi:hypothetical protein